MVATRPKLQCGIENGNNANGVKPVNERSGFALRPQEEHAKAPPFSFQHRFPSETGSPMVPTGFSTTWCSP
jgi:hypothetical protein